MLKKLFFLVILLAFCQSSFSQEETEAFEQENWTISSYLFSQPYVYQNNNFPTLFTGLSLKRYFGPVGVRLGYERIVNKGFLIYQVDSTTSTSEENFLTENAFRIGTEYRHTYYDIISFHLFVDYLINPFDGKYDIFNQNEEKTVEADIKGVSQGIILGMGFDWILTEYLSLGIETRVDFLRNTHDLSIQNYEKGYSVNYIETTSDIQLKLLGNLTLNYHF